MHSFRQGIAVVALVVSLGLVVPGLFGGPASADVSRKSGIQPMALRCDLDGKDATGVDGYEFATEVTSIDLGDELGKMQDLHSNLQFVAVAGKVSSTYTAIEDDTRFAQDDSSPFAKRALESDDPRLEDGEDDYPVTFDIPPAYPFSVFGAGFDTRKSAKEQKNFVDCVATDDGLMSAREAQNELGTTQCLKDDELQDACYQNIWLGGASADNVADSRPCVAFGDEQYGKCMALGVTYHYLDEYHITTQVLGSKAAGVQASGSDGGTLSAAGSGDDGKHRADRSHKQKKGGKHRVNGKHRK
jgi:hypothetical protein